ncbi:SAM-dependent methyltransferase, MidA [Cupriavidus necator H850]|jgi:SAM-dependent MidA family methyltransferase|uniref:class I SAM-dependent methyltransferase n=1 Tax=Cupriavidus TaxID=106589 RepID=UPI00129D3614|nr:MULTISPECIES: class I SAM-dependent methyltransferase [Cupriavidus]KAI3605623.1 SAM-dependent methyltransferase, MidA [Cupriavidus necator H850]QUN28627.1 class I SAM-dependent methyltransferase [Cupriavidus sp. KK10]
MQKAASLPLPPADAQAASDTLTARIGESIDAAGGWIGFDRYMALALYAPGLGYYSGGSAKFGRDARDGSDFITAPELSPFFARTLARQFAPLLAQGLPRMLEFGAGTGRLAADLLLGLEQEGQLPDTYAIVELSGELRARQQATLAQRAPHLADRVTWLDTLPASFEGVIVGNEVLDAMPVQLYARSGGRWHERGVVRGDDATSAFRFEDRPLADADVPEALRDIPGDHELVTETHAEAEGFTRAVGAMLARGAAFFIDYGFPAGEYYHPQRAGGTLMCHYRHHAHPDPFLYPGLQDITAHVNFSGIALAAVDAGLTVAGFASQARFLMNAGITELLMALDPSDARAFLPQANAVQKLLSEAEMGELFKVIALTRALDDSEPMDGFARGDRCHTL